MNQKYEQLNELQNELGDQIRRTWNIMKRVEASYNDCVTKFNDEYQGNLTVLFASSFSLSGAITSPFTHGLGLIVTFAGEGLKLLSNCSSKKRKRELPQLVNKLSQTVGQFKEELHVFEDKKRAFFNQCLDNIVEFCHEHPNELVVLGERGLLSTQVILRDINTFMSRLDDFLSGNKRILGEEEEVSNKEPGVMKEDSCVVMDDKTIMKLIKLIKAPVIVTTGTMKH